MFYTFFPISPTPISPTPISPTPISAFCGSIAVKGYSLSIPVKVTRGERHEEFSNSVESFREHVIYQEFLVSADELDELRDTAYWTSRIWRRTEQPPKLVAPKSGDQIVIDKEVYELAPRNEWPCVSNSDSFGTILRLRTILIQDKK